MRTFEVKIKKDRSEAQTSFAWPSWWGSVKEHVDVVAYQDTKNHGKQTEGCVCVCEDHIWEEIEGYADPAIILLTEAKANTKGRAWRPQTELITDSNALLTVVTKLATGETLTANDTKVLDVEDDTPGRGKSKMFDIRGICKDKGMDLHGK